MGHDKPGKPPLINGQSQCRRAVAGAGHQHALVAAAGEPLTATIRAAMGAVVAAAEADRDLTLARMRLVATVPALEARYAGEERRTIEVLTRLLASRTGRPAGDYQLELVAFVLAAVVFTASRRWVAEQGATPLAALVDQALTTVEPLLAALENAT
jgi:hypothetical protein